MTPSAWSWLLTGIGVTGLFLVSRGFVWAWLVNIAAQALWAIYAIATDQYGFLLAAAAYATVFTMNYRRASAKAGKV